MAKKKSRQDRESDARAAVGAGDASPARGMPVESAAVSPTERSFHAGNYAAVRKLAPTEATPRAAALAALTHIDKGQVAVGLVAMVVVLLVAVLTLR